MENTVYIGLMFFSIENASERKEIINLFVEKMICSVTGKERIKMIKTENGKPVLVYPKGWYYNISHTGKLAVCTIARNPIGVDIEKISYKRDYQAIADEWFHKGEKAILDDCRKFSPELFYHFWTRKESWIKQKGLTIWQMKSTPDMSLSNETVKTWSVKHDIENYSLSLCLSFNKNSLNRISVLFVDNFTDPLFEIQEVDFPVFF